MPSTNVFDLLGRGARELVLALDGSACAVSRVLGDVLVQVAEHIEGAGTLQLGMGYLISDYPMTGEVIERREARALSLADEEVDAAEAALLRELGYDSLLMLPLVAGDSVWGLVEAYRDTGIGFSAEDMSLAEEHVRQLGERLAAAIG